MRSIRLLIAMSLVAAIVIGCGGGGGAAGNSFTVTVSGF